MESLCFIPHEEVSNLWRDASGGKERMRAIITADIHLHPHRQCSQNSGIDRMEDGLKALRQTLQAANERDCPWVFLGDLKHVRGVWHQYALNWAFEIICGEFRDVKKFMIHGNHDGTAGGSGLRPFAEAKANVRLFETPTIFSFFDEQIAIWPWQASTRMLPEFLLQAQHSDARILLGHIFLKNSVVGPNDRPLMQGTALHEIGLTEVAGAPLFKWAFLGDVHKAQIVPGSGNGNGRAIYPGSPLAHNWGEIELDKGCLYVDTSQNLVEHIPIKAPKFRVVDWTKDQPDKAPKIITEWEGDFVKLLLEKDIPPVSLERIKEASGARWFKAYVQKAEKKTETRSEVHAGMSIQELLNEYMRVRPLEKIQSPEKVVLNVGLKLLEEEK